MIKNRKQLKRKIACMQEVKEQSAQDIELEVKMLKFRAEQHFISAAVKKIIGIFV